MSKYMWVRLPQKGNMHLVKWNMIICQVLKGCWSIQDITNFNMFVVVKNFWRATGDSIWAQIIRDKYMKGKHLPN